MTVDHGLQADSAAWTSQAGRAAARFGVAWRALRWTGCKPETGLPAAARRARHALLAQATRAAGGCVLLLAHTADDAAESELIRAATPGHGRLRAWAPSPVWPEGRGVFVLRPMLDLARATLRRELGAAGLDWIEDPANADARFARARARSALARDPERAPHGTQPVEPDMFGAVAFTADPYGGVRLDRGQAGSPALLARAIASASGRERPAKGAAVRRVASRLHAGDAQPWTLGGARIVPEGDGVLLQRELGRAPPAPAPLEPGAGAVFDGRFEIVVEDGGLSVAPLSGRAARLTRADRQRLMDIPALARPALPVLLGADGSAHLPKPFGDGPGWARALAGLRLTAALGQIDTEAQLVQALQGCVRHGADNPPTLSWASVEAGG